MTIDPVGYAKLMHFIQERELIRFKKERGDPWPWTKDPVLQAYRFCNVRREDDKETRLIHAHWLRPHIGDPDLWFAMTVARLINWWPTLEPIGYPAVSWGRKVGHFIHVCGQRKRAGEKVFTSAYMVRADPHVSGSKATYLATQVLQPMWDDRVHIRPRKGDTLAAFHARLMAYKDVGPFVSGQIIADTKWGDNPLRQASDLQDWAAPGPGSQRGLNIVYGRPVDTGWTKDNSWEAAFAELLPRVRQDLKGTSLANLDGQNVQNCLCETMKIHRGSSRNKYSPATT